jgi:hypothetical protein
MKKVRAYECLRRYTDASSSHHVTGYDVSRATKGVTVAVVDQGKDSLYELSLL